MKTRTVFSMVAIAILATGTLVLFGSAPAAAQCLSQEECDGLKAQLHDFKDDVKPLRRQARDLHKQARDLPRGSDERKALRKQARELKKEFRQTRRDHEIRRVMKAFRDGCRKC